METGVGLAQISVAQLNLPTPITPTRSRNGGRMSHTSRVIANFLLKLSNFRSHGNRGWSDTNFTSRVKFADPDYPLLDPGMGSYLPHKPSYCQYFLLKFLNFRCHGNRGWYGTNVSSAVKVADPDYPLLGPGMGVVCLLGPGMGVVSPTQAELLPILCLNNGGWLP